MPIPLPANEAERLAALRRYGVADPTPEEAFDRVTRLAARLFGVPVALVSLVEEDRQVFKSCHGADWTESPREVSFCTHALLTPEVLVVEDARRDPRFAENPFVTADPHIRFYAGAPLVTPDGFALGTLCLIDDAPRSFSAAEAATLSDLAAGVATELELRREVAERRRAEESLRAARAEAEAAARAAHTEKALSEGLLNALADPFFVLDAEGRFTRWNERTAQVTGYTDAELAHRGAMQLFDGPDVERVAAAIPEVLRGEDLLVEADLVTKDGRRVPFEFSGAALHDEAGAAYGICGVGRDLRERKEATARLEASEEKYRTLFEQASDAILIFDPADETILEANARACRLYGFSREELVGRSITSFSADPERGDEQLGRLLEKGALNDFETVQRRRDGTPLRLLISASVVEYEGREAVLSINRDVTARREAEEALRESERRTGEILDSLNDAVWAAEPDGGEMLYLSVAAERLHGYPLEALRTDRSLWHENVHADDRPGLERAMRRLPEDGRVEVEYRIVRPDGEVRWVRDRANAVRDEDGAVVRFAGVASDVTERKRSEAALFQHERLLQGVAEALGLLLAEHSGEAIDEALRTLGTASGADRVYLFEVYPDPETEEPLAHQRHEWVNDGIDPQIDNPDLQGVPLLQAGYGRWYEAFCAGRLISGHVEDFPADERPLLDMQDIQSIVSAPVHIGGETWGFIGFDACRAPRTWSAAEQATLQAAAAGIGDALMRRRAEAALREGRDRYSRVVNSVRDIVFETDADGRWVFLNPVWEAYTGYSVEESLGRPFADFVLPDDRPALEAHLQQSNDPVEGRYLTRDGQTRWVRVLQQLLHDDAGRVVGATGTLHDVTDQHRAMEAMEAALERERELGQLKSRFVSMASHELRTPLTAIRSSVELLQQFGTRWSAERRATLFERVLRNTEQMTELIGDVLVLGKADSGRLPFSPEPLDLVAFCRALRADLRSEDGERLRVHGPRRPVGVHADPKLLRLLLDNLVSNALKYDSSGSPIDLWVEPAEAAVALRLRDRGIGIPEGDLPHLFEPFHRATNAELHPGTGLGLAIAQRVVERHGGTIRAESALGAGTTFHVALPVEGPRPSETPDERPTTEQEPLLQPDPR
jgi:PAS domain S-box-containing protein